MSDHEPIPGENRLYVATFAVFLGLGAAGLVAALIAAIWLADMGPTITVTLVIVALAAAGLAWAILTRRTYLRRVRSGDVIEREPWSGPDTPHTW